nr:MAG TPA: hypothetical protein [Caudoviricetes sp.]DAN44591.1 MAG TPA: hypothetical protein [Bacteriophage sp.]DAY36388.1 MAG TPA: hypothetical protein [Bacteriophage sp.]
MYGTYPYTIFHLVYTFMLKFYMLGVYNKM